MHTNIASIFLSYSGVCTPWVVCFQSTCGIPSGLPISVSRLPLIDSLMFIVISWTSEKTHRALADALMVAEILIRMAETKADHCEHPCLAGKDIMKNRVTRLSLQGAIF